jgi:hypothetical protein
MANVAPVVREGEWIEQIRRGDAAAFEAMARAYGPQRWRRAIASAAAVLHPGKHGAGAP